MSGQFTTGSWLATDTDYLLRCFRAVKDRAKTAVAKAEGHR